MTLPAPSSTGWEGLPHWVARLPSLALLLARCYQGGWLSARMELPADGSEGKKKKKKTSLGQETGQTIR